LLIFACLFGTTLPAAVERYNAGQNYASMQAPIFKEGEATYPPDLLLWNNQCFPILDHISDTKNSQSICYSSIKQPDARSTYAGHLERKSVHELASPSMLAVRYEV
jgi:hypothetical protein